MDNVEQKINGVTAEPAEAEEKSAAAELGKFKSVDALMKAYSQLEAEFTRRSQRLKELEEGSKARGDGGAPSPGDIDKQAALGAVLGDERLKGAVIEEYLKTVSDNKSVPLMVGGESVAAPASKPKSVKEAGALAQRFLK